MIKINEVDKVLTESEESLLNKLIGKLVRYDGRRK